MDLGRFEAVVAGTADGVGGPDGSLGSEPAVLFVVLVAVATVVVGTAVTVYRRRDPANRFVRSLAAVDEVTVLMHPNPDPDAMASALGVRRLARSVGTAATVRYTGRIQHEENRAMRTVLGLEFSPFEDVSELDSENVVLVDHNEPRGFAGAGGLTPYAVVDHHPGSGVGTRFTDVRPGYGSCAAIVAEYLRARGWESDDAGDSRTLGEDLATALLFGIRSDTTDFTRGCTEADFDAAAYVFPASDPEAMDHILNPPVDEEMLDVRARAVQYRERVGSFVCSFVGEVESVEALGQAADELLRLEGVTAVVVAGESDGTLHLSGRSTDGRIHVGEVLSDVVADIPMANAGGHARMGGGQLSVEHMRGLGPSTGVSVDGLRSRVFAALETAVDRR
jgi:nanoRNase/pAp phosphatase (c-di-AMP/oligoRNAs hydrolase)